MLGMKQTIKYFDRAFEEIALFVFKTKVEFETIANILMFLAPMA